MLWTWIKRNIFKMSDSKDPKKSHKSGESAPNDEKAPANPPVGTSLIDERKKLKLRKFELEVFDEDLKDDGTVELKPVKSERAIIVEVATPEELKTVLTQYRMCGQVAKIVREIDPPPAPPPQAQQIAPAAYQQTPMQQMAPQMAPRMMPIQTSAHAVQQVKPKPKIVTIGDMQVKYDGDKVYQKQWVKLNSAEAANFRVVNDSSNKIVSLAGKHIEAKKWILVEETADDSIDDAVESILAGN